MAASLSLCCMLDDHAGDRATSTAETDLAVDLDDYSNNVSALLDIGGALTVPTLTADEEATPLGKMMVNIMGCFATLEKRLEEQRQRYPPEDLNDYDDDDRSDSSCSEFIDLDPVLLSPAPRKRPFSPVLGTDTQGKQVDVPSLQLPPAAIQKEQQAQQQNQQQPEAFQAEQNPQKQQQQQLQRLCWRPPLRMHRGIKGGYPRAPMVVPTPTQSHNYSDSKQSSQATAEQSEFVMNKRMRLVGPPGPPPSRAPQGSHNIHGHESFAGGVGIPFRPPFHNSSHLSCPTVVAVWRQQYVVRALPRFSPPIWNGPPMYAPLLPSWSLSHMKQPLPPQQGASQIARYPPPYHAGHDGQGASVQPN
ncbi:hypothetical protein MHU86_5474 [Fragilaria crotonensis]|nr:hypothetical protein MHU86_5474 [Fragilaria crotonensis]